MTKKKVFFIICLFFCFSTNNYLNASTRETAASFLKLPIGARPSGMGEAYAALADGVDAIYFNPAGLGWVVQPEIQATHAIWFADVSYDFLGYIQPTSLGTFGVGIQYVYMDKMYKISEGVEEGKFSVYDSLGILSYGACLGEKVSLGLNVKVLQCKIDTQKAGAVASDVGVLFCTNREGNSFSMGIVGQNLGSKLEFVEEEEYLPENIKFGLTGRFSFPEQYTDLNLTVDVNKPVNEDYNFCFGLEHWGADILALRCGYKYYLEDNKLKDGDPLSGWGMGLGIKCVGFLLDYAFVPYGGMGHTHRISLSGRFSARAMKKETFSGTEVIISANPRIFSPNKDEIKDKVVFDIMAYDLGKVKKWNFQISDSNSNLIKKYTGKDKIPLKIIWRGTNEIGDVVKDGEYKYILRAKGKGRKNIRSEEGWIVLDTVPPLLNWLVSPPVISPDENGKDDIATISFSTAQVRGIGEWQINILTEEEKLVKAFKGEKMLPFSLIWDGKDDYYKKIVPNGKYSVVATITDEAGNKTVSTPKGIEVKVIQMKEIIIKEDKRGLKVNLSSNVLFVSGKSSLKKQSYKALSEVVMLLDAYSENKVVIEGHTDSVGRASFNQKLSVKRADGVYQYLVKKGIDSKRITVIGFGETKPIAKNSTRQGRAQNRRVEIIILRDPVKKQAVDRTKKEIKEQTKERTKQGKK
jgi:outer membrane protein OmpA-like peptidoglycan-associated protein